MNVFCILKDDGIKRISLSGEIQTDIENYLNKSIQDYVNAEQTEFNGEYKPNEGEVLVINNFQDNSSVNISKEKTLNIEKINPEEIEKIKNLMFVYDDKIAFQCFDNRKIIRPERPYLIYSGNTFSKIENKGFTVSDKVDAVLLKNEQKLLFESYHNARRIFELNSYYREATNEEIQAFCNENIFKLQTNIETELFNTRIRKKIYLINKNKLLQTVTQKFDVVFDHAQKFNLGCFFDNENKKIIFPAEKKDIENLINFLNDDLFQSPISDCIYQTNSKKRIT